VEGCLSGEWQCGQCGVVVQCSGAEGAAEMVHTLHLRGSNSGQKPFTKSYIRT
jgi:hypothetical protein